MKWYTTEAESRPLPFSESGEVMGMAIVNPNQDRGNGLDLLLQICNALLLGGVLGLAASG